MSTRHNFECGDPIVSAEQQTAPESDRGVRRELCVICVEMAYKCREEIVGKRFLSVSGGFPGKLKAGKISEWGWRAGVVRASSHKDNGHPDLQVNAPRKKGVCTCQPGHAPSSRFDCLFAA